MKNFKHLLCLFLGIAVFISISGCSYIVAMKVSSPEAFGMEKIYPNVYVNPEMPNNSREELLEHMKEAKQNIVSVYGSVKSTPDVIACSTEECYKKFGGTTSIAQNYEGSSFLLSPRGITTPTITHEWAHSELYIRLDNNRSIPQWFDEGLAVIASHEPNHSEEVWEYIVKNNIPKPSLDNLLSPEQWYKAVLTYGALADTDHNPNKIRVVYATAGHEVRKWFNCAKKSGVLKIIDLIQSDYEFSNAYELSKKMECGKTV